MVAKNIRDLLTATRKARGSMLRGRGGRLRRARQKV
jgi:hypothetical protein